MRQRPPLTASQKEQIITLKQQGWSLPHIAGAIPCSYEAARKGWRRYRDQGQTGLAVRA